MGDVQVPAGLEQDNVQAASVSSLAAHGPAAPEPTTMAS